MKKNILTLGAIICLLFANNNSFACEDAIIKSDYKTAYKFYNEQFKKNKNAKTYANMCRFSIYFDENAAKMYCKDALTLIEKEKSPNKEVYSNILSMMGELYSFAYNNKNISLDYINKAKEIKEKNNTDKYELSKTYHALFRHYIEEGNKILAEEYLNKAIDSIKNETELKYKVIRAAYYNNYALLERRNQNYSLSKEYLDKALEEVSNAGDYSNKILNAAIYINLGNYYKYNEKDSKKAISYYQKASQEYGKYPDESLFNIKEDELDTDMLQKKYEEYPYEISTLIALGGKNIKTNETKANEYFTKALDINKLNPYIYIAIADEYSKAYNETKKIEYKNTSQNNIKLANKNALYNPEIYISAGIICLDINAKQDAKKYFNNFIKYSGNKQEAYLTIATAYWYNKELKNKKQVIKNINKAMKIDSNINEIYKSMLIESYKLIGKDKEVEKLNKTLFNN